MARILLVDDDESGLHILEIGLQHAGHSVVLATTGEEGLSVIQANPPDCLFLDLRLPGLSGFGVLALMREQSLVIPTAVMTGYPAEFSLQDASALGAAAYLRKPLFIEDLLQQIDRLTGGLRVQPSPSDTTSVAPETARLEQLIEKVSRDLPRLLRRAFPRVAADVIADAVEDAVIEHWRTRLRSDELPVLRHLYVAAWRNVANTLKSERQRRFRETTYFAGIATRTDASADEPYDAGYQFIQLALEQIVDPVEREAISRWLAGDHSTRAFGAIARLQGMTSADLSKEVKRTKDAFIKRVLRNAKRNRS